MNEYQETYLSLMHEVKRRHRSLLAAYDDPSVLLYKAAVIDHCYMQFRKILELMAFSVLSANQYQLTALQLGKSRDYHAEKILKAIERKFGSVYPKPITQIMDPRPGVRADFQDFQGDFLTRADFSELYTSCGNVLHARSPFRNPLDLDPYWEAIPKYENKIRNLLNSHLATIVTDPNLYLVQMSQGDERPTLTTFAPAPAP